MPIVFAFQVLDVPLTVKLRTGVYDKNWNAHKLLPCLKEWGASLATVSANRKGREKDRERETEGETERERQKERQRERVER